MVVKLTTVKFLIVILVSTGNGVTKLTCPAEFLFILRLLFNFLTFDYLYQEAYYQNVMHYSVYRGISIECVV